MVRQGVMRVQDTLDTVAEDTAELRTAVDGLHDKADESSLTAEQAHRELTQALEQNKVLELSRIEKLIQAQSDGTQSLDEIKVRGGRGWLAGGQLI